MTTKILVRNLSPKVSQQQIHDFFLFCGAIRTIEMLGDNAATVEFKEERAGKTALMLTNAMIIDKNIQVEKYDSSKAPAPLQQTENRTEDAQKTEQQKPSTPQEQKAYMTVVTELISAGYTMSDEIIKRATALDVTYGLSGKVSSLIGMAVDQAKTIDSVFHVSEKADGVKNAVMNKAGELDTKYEIQGRLAAVGAVATGVARGAGEMAMNTKAGQAVTHIAKNIEQEVNKAHADGKRKAEEKRSAGSTKGAESPKSGEENFPASPSHPETKTADANASQDKRKEAI